MVAAFGALGCRQLAGIENIMPAPPTDAPGDTPAPGDAGRCGCPGCTQLAKMGVPSLPLSLVLVGADLFVLSYGPDVGQGALLRVPTSGTGDAAPEILQGNLTRPFSIAADATHLYWIGEDGKGGGIVEKYPLAGGSAVTLASGLPTHTLISTGDVLNPSNSYLALTATDVYFVEFPGGSPGGVDSVPIDGGVTRPFIPYNEADAGLTADSGLTDLNPVWAYAIATDGKSLFVLNVNATNGVGCFDGIFEVPLSGGPPKLVINPINYGGNLALAGNDVVFTEYATGTMTAAGTLSTVPKSGAPKGKVLDGMLGLPWAIAVDQGVAYLANLSDGTNKDTGTLVKVDVGGGRPATLASSIPAIEDLVVDSEYVYWVDSSCGTVMKIRK
jgi:hypothetical protein